MCPRCSCRHHWFERCRVCVIDQHAGKSRRAVPCFLASGHKSVKNVTGIGKGTEWVSLGRHGLGVRGSCLSEMGVQGAVELAIGSTVLKSIALVGQGGMEHAVVLGLDLALNKLGPGLIVVRHGAYQLGSCFDIQGPML